MSKASNVVANLVFIVWWSFITFSSGFVTTSPTASDQLKFYGSLALVIVGVFFLFGTPISQWNTRFVKFNNIYLVVSAIATVGVLICWLVIR